MSKALVAQSLAKRVKDGEVIGLGSGSTAELAVEQIGHRIAKEGIRVSGVPTSYRIALCAEKVGIQVLSSITSAKLAWGFDGADEIDPAFNMIKGNGAAMLSEKLLARRAGDNFVIIVSADKMVEKLGSKFPVPVEVIPEGLAVAEEGLKKLGAKEIVLRDSKTKYGPTVTEHNNLILDVRFDSLTPDMEDRIKCITGVVESGLFVGTTKEVIVSREDGVFVRRMANGKVSEEALK